MAIGTAKGKLTEIIPQEAAKALTEAFSYLDDATRYTGADERTDRADNCQLAHNALAGIERLLKAPDQTRLVDARAAIERELAGLPVSSHKPVTL